MTLSTLEIARLRSEQGDYLPDTCTLQTLSRTSDSQGGWTETWSNTYTSVPCRLAPLTQDVHLWNRPLRTTNHADGNPQCPSALTSKSTAIPLAQGLLPQSHRQSILAGRRFAVGPRS